MTPSPPKKRICNKILFYKTSKHLPSEDFLSIDSKDVPSMRYVTTSPTRITASSLEYPECYQILIYLLYSCLSGFTWLNRGACLDLLKTLIHSISKPNFSCSSQIYSCIYWQKTLNLTPLSTTTLWDRLEWALLVEPGKQQKQLHFNLCRQRNPLFHTGYKKETYQKILQGTLIPCNTDAHFGAFRSPIILIFVHMTLSHWLVHRERTNHNKISTYNCVNSV